MIGIRPSSPLTLEGTVWYSREQLYHTSSDKYLIRLSCLRDDDGPHQWYFDGPLFKKYKGHSTSIFRVSSVESGDFGNGCHQI